MKLEKRNAVINKAVLPVCLAYSLEFFDGKSERVSNISLLCLKQDAYYAFIRSIGIGDCHADIRWYLPDLQVGEEQAPKSPCHVRWLDKAKAQSQDDEVFSLKNLLLPP